MNSGGNGPVKARKGLEYKYVETRCRARWSVCTLNTCKKQLSNCCFCLTAISLLTWMLPSKAFLALGVKTITLQNTTIAVFLQELRVGIKSASSARWAYFFLLLLSLQSNVYYMSLSHRWTWKFEGDWSKRFFLDMPHRCYWDIWAKQFSTDPSQVQSTQNFSFSAVRDAVGIW